MLTCDAAKKFPEIFAQARSHALVMAAGKTNRASGGTIAAFTISPRSKKISDPA
jgi:hypothetical protein